MKQKKEVNYNDNHIKNPILKFLHGTVGWIVIIMLIASLLLGVIDWVRNWGNTNSEPSGDYCAGVDDSDCPSADYGMPGTQW